MKPFRLSFVAPVLALFALFFAASTVRAQSNDERFKDETVKPEATQGETPTKGHVGLPTDWSHHYLIYSNAARIANSDSPKAKSLQAQPRFKQALARRTAMQHGLAEPTAAELRARALLPPDAAAPAATEGGLTKDWTSSLTTSGTVGDEQYPAKFSFNVNATPSCTADFAVFNNNQASGNHGSTFSDRCHGLRVFLRNTSEWRASSRSRVSALQQLAPRLTSMA